MQLLIPIAGAAVYALPILIACIRPLPKPDRWSIILGSLAFGWTIVAWGFFLWWAIAYTGAHHGRIGTKARS